MKNNSLAKKIFFSVVLILMPWIFFDVDMGDQSYSSIAAWLMAFHPKLPTGTQPFWFEVLPIFGSFIPHFIVYKIFGPHVPLIAFRFLWLVWHAMLALSIFKVLNHENKSSKSVSALVLTAMACVVGADYFALTYNTVAVGFGLLSVVTLSLGLKDEMRSHALGFACLSGLFAVLSICSRLPVGVFFALYWFILLALFWKTKEKLLPKLSKGLVLGWAAGLLIITAFLWASNQYTYFLPGLKGFVLGVINRSDVRYSVDGSFAKLIGHYSKITIGALIFLALMGLFRFNKFKNLVPLLWIGITAFIAFLSFKKYGIVLSLIIGGAIVLVVCDIYYRKLQLSSMEWTIRIGAFFVLFAFPFGTYVEGIQNYKYGLWLILPLALTAAHGFKVLGDAQKLLSLSIVVLFIVTRVSWPTFPYQEKPLKTMAHFFQTPALKGLLTYPEKSQAIDDLTNQLSLLGLKSGDLLFCYAGTSPYYPISLIYQITHTIPLLHDPAVVEYPGSRWKRHYEMILQMIQKNQFPKIIVRQKQLFAGADFKQQTPFNWSTPEENWLPGEIDRLLRSSGYKAVWENAFFVILKN